MGAPRKLLSTKSLRDSVKWRTQKDIRGPIPVQTKELARLLDVYEYAARLSKRPCQCGHVDGKRCWQHAHDWAPVQWCEPCEAEFVLTKGGKAVG